MRYPLPLLVSFVFSLLLWINSAAAHTHLSTSQPGNGANLSESPKEISLNFTGPVRPLKIQLSNEFGKNFELGFKRSKQASKAFSWAVEELDAGNYQIDWAVIGEDGHKMTGKVDFTLKP